MATHSSVLAWRIPGTGEPGGLPSMGSHRVGHDWSDLAEAAAAAAAQSKLMFKSHHTLSFNFSYYISAIILFQLSILELLIGYFQNCLVSFMVSSSLHMIFILSIVLLFMCWHAHNSNIWSPSICGFCPLPSGHLPFVPHDFRLDAPVCLVLVCGCPILCRLSKTECSHLSGRSLSTAHLPCLKLWPLLKHRCPDAMFSPGLLCLCFCPENPLTSLGTVIERVCYNLLQDFSFLNQKEFSEYLLTDQSI